MHDKFKIVYKKVGQTPLDCINELKKDAPELVHLPMTYAGRLDPLAEGVLIILIGDECLKKDEYLNLTKEYELTILFGFTTDTYDVMGRVISTRRSEDLLNTSFDEAIKEILPKFTGRIKQSYPPYSSRTVKGIPLFKWARDGKLDEIEIPTHDVFVENIEIMKSEDIKGEELSKKIKENISAVRGDFRQKEILSIWDRELKDKKEIIFKTITLKVSCGSGVYVRALANDIGITLGVPALALKIVRTKVGDYKL